MGLKVRKINCYSAIIDSARGSEELFLSIFSGAGVNYLAFNAKPAGSGKIEFSRYPKENQLFLDVLKGSRKPM